MSGRRNDGFRVADARQVRIDVLETKVRALRDERDAARTEAKQARRALGELGARCDDLRRQLRIARLATETERSISAAMRTTIETLRADFDRLPLHRIAWARLRGAVIRVMDRRSS